MNDAMMFDPKIALGTVVVNACVVGMCTIVWGTGDVVRNIRSVVAFVRENPGEVLLHAALAHGAIVLARGVPGIEAYLVRVAYLATGAMIGVGIGSIPLVRMLLRSTIPSLMTFGMRSAGGAHATE